MMEWLSGWLREIILVVLLSTFVDMLLPNKSMERYVKLVLSLLILLTLISPIINLFNRESNERLSAALTDWGGGSTEEQDMTLAEIMDKGRELTQQHEMSAMNWAAAEVADQMKAQIEQESQMPVKSVTVQLGALEKSGRKSEETGITSVEVVIAETYSEQEAEQGQQGNTGEQNPLEETNELGPIYIQPVETSDIQVNASETMSTPDQETTTDDEVISAMTTTEINLIEELLEQEWEVNPERVRVLIPSTDN
ncbi:stage III sporulation protein AF [Paenibacillus sp. 453mf]|uniref:stage III sporulation protein AF n=1 Tax=Paenibacillus sp. 453mf TaxID=1761874 RepID=UPI000B86FE12|nr:stage III sporulation protein AF [Paenibacillus sp. 453mf]